MTDAPKLIWAKITPVVQARRWEDKEPVAPPGRRLLDTYRAYVQAEIAGEMLAALKGLAEMAALGTDAIIELDRADDWPDGWSGEKDIRIVRARAVIAKAEGSDING